jgi:hypothetical protein
LYRFEDEANNSVFDEGGIHFNLGLQPLLRLLAILVLVPFLSLDQIELWFIAADGDEKASTGIALDNIIATNNGKMFFRSIINH